jgi:hypothetical protein
VRLISEIKTKYCNIILISETLKLKKGIDNREQRSKAAALNNAKVHMTTEKAPSGALGRNGTQKYISYMFQSNRLNH